MDGAPSGGSSKQECGTWHLNAEKNQASTLQKLLTRPNNSQIFNFGNKSIKASELY